MSTLHSHFHYSLIICILYVAFDIFQKRIAYHNHHGKERNLLGLKLYLEYAYHLLSNLGLILF